MELNLDEIQLIRLYRELLLFKQIIENKSDPSLLCPECKSYKPANQQPGAVSLPAKNLMSFIFISLSYFSFLSNQFYRISGYRHATIVLRKSATHYAACSGIHTP